MNLPLWTLAFICVLSFFPAAEAAKKEKPWKGLKGPARKKCKKLYRMGCDKDCGKEKCLRRVNKLVDMGFGEYLPETCQSKESVGCNPVMCEMFCLNGFAVDENGCEVCECKPDCEPPKCNTRCPHGFALDNDGCEICRCNPYCEPLVCDVYCEHGNVPDKNGCPTCDCNPPKCPKGEEPNANHECVPVSCDSPSACPKPGDYCEPDDSIRCVTFPCAQFECNTCPPICLIACEFGNVLDENGCPSCNCNTPPCPKGEELDVSDKCVPV